MGPLALTMLATGMPAVCQKELQQVVDFWNQLLAIIMATVMGGV